IPLRHLLFPLLLIIIAWYYSYNEIAPKRPQGVHAWRQSDAASMALNYHEHGYRFFHPETHNLTSDGGTTGYCATSEVPLLYYTVAIFYALVGEHEGIFRVLNTLLFFFGLWS